MLAHAFLAVTAAAEPDPTPAPAGLIELTTAELRRLFDGRLPHTPRPPSALLACPPGDDDTKPGHGPATTEHAKHNSNDLRL